MSLARAAATIRAFRHRLASLQSIAARRLGLDGLWESKAQLRSKTALLDRSSEAALSLRARQVLRDLERQRDRHEAGGTRSAGKR